MAVCWRDVSVEYRDTAAGQRQHEALSRFQRESGLDATQAARTVGLSYPQYNRYLWGRLPLRTDQIPRFAAAYGVPKSELTRALGLLDDAMEQPPAPQPEIVVPPGWTMREALQSVVPEADLDALIAHWKRFPIENQYVAAIDLLGSARAEIEKRTIKPRRDQTA